MDFSTAYFGKPLNELEYSDVQAYFETPKVESETIEFKSFPERATFDAGLQSVIRGISAFLNSSGGILIWGAPSGTKQKGQTEDVFEGTLAPVRELKEKDALINKISSCITPLPIGINVQILHSDGSYLYIFEIQASLYKPHQYDTRYYIRLDGQTKPAPHYLVEALMKRISYPNINGVIRFNKVIHQPDRRLITISVGIFNFSELQNEEAVSFRVRLIGGLFPKSREQQYTTQRTQYGRDGKELIYNDFAKVLHFGTPNIHENVISVEGSKSLDVILSFGGKSSPARMSSYRFDLSKIKNCDNPNDMLIEISENVLFAEINKEFNNTPENVLSTFLGR